MAELSTMETQGTPEKESIARKVPKKKRKRKIVKRIVWTLIILLVVSGFIMTRKNTAEIVETTKFDMKTVVKLKNVGEMVDVIEQEA